MRYTTATITVLLTMICGCYPETTSENPLFEQSDNGSDLSDNEFDDEQVEIKDDKEQPDKGIADNDPEDDNQIVGDDSFMVQDDDSFENTVQDGFVDYTGVFSEVVELIVRRNGDLFYSYCSGTALSPNSILTAAHCVCPIPGNFSGSETDINMHCDPIGEDAGNISVEIWFFKDNYASPQLTKKAKTVYLMGGYTSPVKKSDGNWVNTSEPKSDIALIILEDCISNDFSIPYAKIAQSSSPNGFNVLYVGFGISDGCNDTSIDNVRRFAQVSKFSVPDSNQIRIESEHHNIGGGDSGGPLFFGPVSNTPRNILGVASHGTCNDSGMSYGDFENAVLFKEILENKINEHASECSFPEPVCVEGSVRNEQENECSYSDICVLTGLKTVSFEVCINGEWESEKTADTCTRNTTGIVCENSGSCNNGICEHESAPTEEICNGFDDNGSGRIDDAGVTKMICMREIWRYSRITDPKNVRLQWSTDYGYVPVTNIDGYKTPSSTGYPRFIIYNTNVSGTTKLYYCVKNSSPYDNYYTTNSSDPVCSGSYSSITSETFIGYVLSNEPGSGKKYANWLYNDHGGVNYNQPLNPVALYTMKYASTGQHNFCAKNTIAGLIDQGWCCERGPADSCNGNWCSGTINTTPVGWVFMP